MKSLLTCAKLTDCRRPKRPPGGHSPGAWRVLLSLLGVLLVSISARPQVASSQSTGSACLAAPTLAMTGNRIVDVSSGAALQSAMGNLQAGDTIVLADGMYNLTSTLYVNGRDNVTIRDNSGCDQVVLLGTWDGQLE